MIRLCFTLTNSLIFATIHAISEENDDSTILHEYESEKRGRKLACPLDYHFIDSRGSYRHEQNLFSEISPPTMPQLPYFREKKSIFLNDSYLLEKYTLMRVDEIKHPTTQRQFRNRQLGEISRSARFNEKSERANARARR